MECERAVESKRTMDIGRGMDGRGRAANKYKIVRKEMVADEVQNSAK